MPDAGNSRNCNDGNGRQRRVMGDADISIKSANPAVRRPPGPDIHIRGKYGYIRTLY